MNRIRITHPTDDVIVAKIILRMKDDFLLKDIIETIRPLVPTLTGRRLYNKIVENLNLLEKKGFIVYNNWRYTVLPEDE